MPTDKLQAALRFQSTPDLVNRENHDSTSIMGLSVLVSIHSRFS